MGTRFIATKETQAHANYKQAIIDAAETDTVVIKRSIGAPARALRNEWTEHILEIEKQEASYDSLKEYISGKANQKYINEGDAREGFGWAGQSAARIHDLPTVQTLIQRIVKEAEAIKDKWSD